MGGGPAHARLKKPAAVRPCQGDLCAQPRHIIDNLPDKRIRVHAAALLINTGDPELAAVDLGIIGHGVIDGRVLQYCGHDP